MTPLINAIAVANGGVIESRGDFPLQTAMSLAVSHGGTVDARTISANNITAAVAQGGRILANPQVTMVASVSNGGVITYWGTRKSRHRPNTEERSLKARPAIWTNLCLMSKPPSHVLLPRRLRLVQSARGQLLSNDRWQDSVSVWVCLKKFRLKR